MSDEPARVPLRSVLLVAAVVAIAATALYGLRTVTVCDGGGVGCFVVAGDVYTDPDAVALPVESGEGYDGQFFYRQARSPFDLGEGPANGVRFDNEVRPGRVGYPLAVWAASGAGQAPLVPWAMLAVDIASLAAVGALVGAAALRAGRSVWWGLVATAIPGLWFAAGRVLADPFSAALAAGAVLAIQTRRHRLAALLLCAGVLTKEQVVIVPLAYGAARLWTMLGERRLRLGSEDLVWLAPGAVFAAWQTVVLVATGTAPATASGGTHAAWPGTDLLPAMVDWLTPDGGDVVLWLKTEALWLAAAVALVWLAVVVVSSTGSQLWERLVGAATIVLVLVLNDFVVADPAYFRQLGDLAVVLTIVALRAPPARWVPPVAINAAATAGVAALALRIP